jgi:hypothetical protein
MGFNKKTLPSKEKLQSMVYDYGTEEVVLRYKNADMLMGNSEAMAYLQTIIREYELGQ